MKKFTHKEVTYLVVLSLVYNTAPMALFVEKMQRNNCNRMVVVDEFPSAEEMHKMLDTEPDQKMQIKVKVASPNPSLN